MSLTREYEAARDRAVKDARIHLLRAWAFAQDLGEWRAFEQWAGDVFAQALADEVGDNVNRTQQPAQRNRGGGL